MKGLVTVFGGSGFVGAQIVRVLARDGWRIRVAVRNPGRGYRLPMLGDVGQIEVVQANIRMPASVHRALAGAEACVNCVAVLHEAGRQRFQSLHVMGAQSVAEAARAHGVTRFIQISSLGADPGSTSKYARSKAEGEAAVLAAVPSATVLRPSVIFGPGDHFFNRFAAMATLSPVLPLIGGGETRFQPVYVADVAGATVAALASDAASGQTYELGGPGVFTFRELMQILLKEIGRERVLLPIPFPLAGPLGMVGDVIAAMSGVLPVLQPPVTSDQLELLKTDNVVPPGALGLADLGVKAHALEPIIPSYLYPYRKGGQFAGMAPLVAKAP